MRIFCTAIKRTVRALKKLQTKLVEEGVLEKELAECIVYNVPNDRFNHTTYKADIRAVLAYIFNETLDKGNWNDWHEVHELRYLFRDSDWSRTELHTLASEAWDYIGFD